MDYTVSGTSSNQSARTSLGLPTATGMVAGVAFGALGFLVWHRLPARMPLYKSVEMRHLIGVSSVLSGVAIAALMRSDAIADPVVADPVVVDPVVADPVVADPVVADPVVAMTSEGAAIMARIEGGNGSAMDYTALGIAFLNGVQGDEEHGVPADPKVAADCFRAALEKDSAFVPAHINLGDLSTEQPSPHYGNAYDAAVGLTESKSTYDEGVVFVADLMERGHQLAFEEVVRLARWMHYPSILRLKAFADSGNLEAKFQMGLYYYSNLQTLNRRRAPNGNLTWGASELRLKLADGYLKAAAAGGHAEALRECERRALALDAPEPLLDEMSTNG